MSHRFQFWLGVSILMMVGGLVVWKSFPPASRSAVLSNRAASALKSPAPKSLSAVNSPAVVAVPALVPATNDFRAFEQQYLESSPVQRLELEKSAAEILATRRVWLKELIQSDPERALQEAASQEFRIALPSHLAALLEARIDQRGDLAVLGVLGQPGQNISRPIRREAAFADQTFEAFVYGRRLKHRTLRQIPLHGIAIDSVMAVSSSPVRVLSPLETAQRMGQYVDPLCDISGESALALATPAVLQVAEEEVIVCSPIHVGLMEEKLIQREDQQLAAAAEGSLGDKNLVYVRVDFSDLQGEPVSNEALTNLHTELKTFYSENSYGRTKFTDIGSGSIITPTYRLAKTAAYYGGKPASELRNDALAAAKAGGINIALEDLDLICFKRIESFGFSGLGYIGASGTWINGEFTLRVAAHELGHNYGLLHANAWVTSGPTATEATGTNEEYGDPFDVMGLQGSLDRHFSAANKHYLNWIPAGNIASFTTNGIYRIQPQDRSLEGNLGIRIPYTPGTNYWLEVRDRLAALKGQVGLRWEWIGDLPQVLLLDSTPGSAAGRQDSGMILGKTFSDTFLDLHITPLALAGTGVDVMIQRGPFPENRAPHITLNTNNVILVPDEPLNLVAQVYDINGDPLTISWDFGDGTTTNGVTQVSKTWDGIGEYRVFCQVSDMKGGVSSASAIVSVGVSPFRKITGVIRFNGWPVEGVNVTVSPASSGSGPAVVQTDSTGSYAITGLLPRSYTVSAALRGFTFQSEFDNPVSVMLDVTNQNFRASPVPDFKLKTLVPQFSAWSYFDKGRLPAVNWMNPDYDDSTWSMGHAQLGFGGDGEKTQLSFGPNPAQKYTAYYFRHYFQVTDLSQMTNLAIRLLRDDGAIVYINGAEIARDNMPTGAVTYATTATASSNYGDEKKYFSFPVPLTALRLGQNVIAVEVHQSSPFSDDLSFDLQLDAWEPRVYRPFYLTQFPDQGAVVLSWPATVEGWILQQGIQLPTDWTPVQSNLITTRHGYFEFRTPAVPKSFYRLAK